MASYDIVSRWLIFSESLLGNLGVSLHPNGFILLSTAGTSKYKSQFQRGVF